MNKLLNVMLFITLVFSTMFTVGCGSDSSDYVVASDDKDTQVVRFLVSNGSLGGSARAMIQQYNIYVNCIKYEPIPYSEPIAGSSEVDGYFRFDVNFTRQELNDAMKNGLLVVKDRQTKMLNCKKLFESFLGGFNPKSYSEIRFDTGMNYITAAFSVNRENISVSREEADIVLVDPIWDTKTKMEIFGDNVCFTCGNNVQEVIDLQATVEGVNVNYKKDVSFSDIDKFYCDYRGNEILAMLKPVYKDKLSAGEYNCHLISATYINTDNKVVEVVTSNVEDCRYIKE